jgi:hypothetical protein
VLGVFVIAPDAARFVLAFVSVALDEFGEREAFDDGTPVERVVPLGRGKFRLRASSFEPDVG